MIETLLVRVRNGAVAGAAATTAMSPVLLVAGRNSTEGQPSPKRITQRALSKLGRRQSRREESRLAAAAHYAFGIAGGALYGVAFGRHASKPAAGVAYATAVALVSYQGWVPMIGAARPLSRASWGHRAAIFGSHLIYGLTLAETVRRLEEESAPDAD